MSRNLHEVRRAGVGSWHDVKVVYNSRYYV